MHPILCRFRKKVPLDLFGWTACWSKSFKSDLSSWICMKALLLQRTSLHGEIELTLESTKLKSESDYFLVALSCCVSQGGSLSHINLHFVVLTLWDYLTQEASHTIRFMLGIYCMTESRSWKRKRVLPNPRHHKQETGHYNYASLAKRLAKQIFLMTTAPKLFLK